MSFSDADRVTWKKIFNTEFMSSDESGEEDGSAVFIVKKLPWRSERVSNFFERLDTARASRKTEQASRQTKPRSLKTCSLWGSQLDSDPAVNRLTSDDQDFHFAV